MRAQAQGLSSAANSDGSAHRGSVAGSRDAATRASSRNSNGSSAPSRGRTRLSLTALAIAAFALLALAPLSQAKEVVGGFGVDTQGNGVPDFGDQLNTPNGVAVNNSGVGAARGTVYVADSGLDRVQRFDPSGAFELAWGTDVIATTVNEQQQLRLSATAGTYTLTFKGDTTDPIPFGPSFGGSTGQQALENALGALPSVNGAANVDVTGNSPTRAVITFQGALGASDQPLLTVDPSGLVGTASVSPIADGSATADTGTGFEICRVASHCKDGETSPTTGNGGQLRDPQGIAIDPATGNVYVTESGNRRVSQFDADGNFIRAWGWDAVLTGRTGDVSTSDFEICTAEADCQRADSSDNGGQFGSTMGYPVIGPAGNVWIPDATNERIQAFDASGNFIAAYGYDVDAVGGGGAMESCTSTAINDCKAGTSGSDPGKFSSNNPKDLDFDSAGNLYALDSGNDRVQRFDPTLLASVADFATGTFPTYTTDAPEHIDATQGGTRLVFSVNNNVSASERQLLEIDPTDDSVKDTSLVGSGLTGSSGVRGIAEDADSGDLRVTTDASASTRKVIRLSSTPPADAPVPAISPVLVRGESHALLRGTVDPRGGLVTCAFEYSTDNRSWDTLAEPDCTSLLEGGGIQVVGEALLRLTPNTHYFARLSVSRPLAPNSTVTSDTVEFDTDAPPPGVSFVGVSDVQDTTARISGTIDPRNSQTGYVFEYGTTPALGQSTTPIDIGGGTTPQTVSQLVRGLTPDTTYHFRLRATNASGDTAVSGGTFHTRADPIPLPDNRAYEMVSPPDKNGGDVNRINVTQGAVGTNSSDGERVAFCTNSLFGEEPSQLGPKVCVAYLSSRTPGGWETKNLMPRYCYGDTASGGAFTSIAYQQANLSLDRLVTSKSEPFGCALAPLDPAAPFSPNGESGSLYLQDPSSDINDPSSFRLLASEAVSGNGVVAGSADFSHVFFRSIANQTIPPDSPAPGGFEKLYEWIEPGPDCGLADPSYMPALSACVRLASVRPDGTPFTVSSSYPPVEDAGAGNRPARNAVSQDGRRFYFTNRTTPVGIGGFPAFNPACFQVGVDCQLYMREDGATTFHVAESECTVDCDPIDRSSSFIWATPDGSVALFASSDKLSDDAASDGGLYRWDRDAFPGSRLTAIFRGTGTGNSGGGFGGDGAPQGGVMGVSDDGDTIYIFRKGGIRRWQWNGGSPTIDVLGPTSDASFGSDNFVNGFGNGNRTTPDGRYLLASVATQLDPAVDKDADRDMYRWDEENGWICLSCQLPGVVSRGHAQVGTAVELANEAITYGLGSRGQQPLMSPDGQRIFFDTPDALVPEDTNGEAGCPDTGGGSAAYVRYTCADVYQWNDGRISLITSGKSSSASLLIGAEWTNGAEDVFFYTRERLVGWDLDDNVDIYNARVGGGFPEPPAEGAPCEGDACRGADSPAPSGAAATGAGSRALVHQGNVEPKPNTCGRFNKKAKRKLNVARRAAKRGQAKRARKLRKQAKNLRRRAKRCNRRAAR